MSTPKQRHQALMSRHRRQWRLLLDRQAAARQKLERKQTAEFRALTDQLACEDEAVTACVQPAPARRRLPPLVPSRAVLPAAPPRGATLTDIQQFAEAVERTAQTQPAEYRFGEQVFLGPIAREMIRGRQVKSREHFRLLLQLARQRGLLQLSRADLVSAMNPELVRESEFRDLNATWHLLTPRG